MRISVALATYNGAKYLQEQLSSIAEQTMLPAELVVSDDGSSDETMEILRAFEKVAPFPVVLAEKTQRLGFADNFLHAAEMCRHELIAFCDQDDIWLPDKLKVGAQRIVDDGSLMSLHTLTVTDDTLRPTGFHWKQEIEEDRFYQPLELDPFATGWANTMLFRRELVGLLPREARPQQPLEHHRPLSHDTWIYVLAAALGRVSHITAPLILYRQHGTSTTGMTKPQFRSKLLSMITVPIVQWRDHALFDGQMANLFAKLAQEPGPFANAASAAADRFAERHARWSARVGVFDGNSISARLQSYRALQHLPGKPRPWFGSRIKDMVLGVSGFNTQLRSLFGRAAAF